MMIYEAGGRARHTVTLVTTRRLVVTLTPSLYF